MELNINNGSNHIIFLYTFDFLTIIKIHCAFKFTLALTLVSYFKSVAVFIPIHTSHGQSVKLINYVYW